jgi:hypothetical protein
VKEHVDDVAQIKIVIRRAKKKELVKEQVDDMSQTNLVVGNEQIIKLT